MTVVGSLCSGTGALDLALLEFLGDARVAWHVENDKHPSMILDHRFPDVPNHGDVTNLDHAALEPIDWLTAGYPCQPFSQAGKRQGANDERHLWPFVADTVRVLRPRGVLLENVAGHLSLGFGQVLGDLAGLGYDARWVRLRASDAGAPHRRERVFIVASDAGRFGEQRRGGSPELVGPARAGQGDRGQRERIRDATGNGGADVADPDDAGRIEHGGAVAVAAKLAATEYRGDPVEWGVYSEESSSDPSRGEATAGSVPDLRRP